MYIEKQKQKNKFADFKQKFVYFQNLLKNKFCWRSLIFEILII